jgi:hypothetical protein
MAGIVANRKLAVNSRLHRAQHRRREVEVMMRNSGVRLREALLNTNGLVVYGQVPESGRVYFGDNSLGRIYSCRREDRAANFFEAAGTQTCQAEFGFRAPVLRHMAKTG